MRLTQDGTFRIDQTGDIDVVYGREYALQQIVVDAFDAATTLDGEPAHVRELSRFRDRLRSRLTDSEYVSGVRTISLDRTDETTLDVTVELRSSETFQATVSL